MTPRLLALLSLGACLASAACPSGPSSTGSGKAATLERKIDLIEGQAGRREAAARAFDELAAVLPDGTWLTEIIYDSEGIRAKGHSPSNTVVADYASSLGASPSLAAVELESSAQKRARGRDYQEFALQARVKNRAAGGSSKVEAGSDADRAAALAGRLAELEKMLPASKETADLLRQFQQAAVESGLKIVKFAPGAETPGELYNEWPVSIEITGSRGGLVRFLKSLADWPQLWLIKKCFLKAISADDPGSPVAASITVRTLLVRESN